ncbi:MBL fold metallo-hydrolase [Vitiosangium sp. GDMCC 1.1324]|uniref:MBL fold metallo-hydrolase n=1 Tax=Vitiosangium sp. (strain GDMCC 1.1324) TaxID=2138576 RepID=UPI000D34B36A|nr:MBL fold metallo-hydrolase [Vitiosangium sp. GDMCC 1.1324]PTL76541.1 hypothetical protein DAT35_48885 [Vitiosangium sp. GDMCC 1.1324]
MKTSVRWLLGTVLAGASLAWVVKGRASSPPASAPHRPELEYLKVVNRAGPATDPQLIFLLMGQYANAHLHREGAEFFSVLLRDFEPHLSDVQKALYLSAIGVLRAGHADEVAVTSRLGWVRDTIAILEEARRLSGGNVFVVRWMAGVVHAQLPALFGKKEAALSDLTWCLANAEKAPDAGWLREVYYQLASLYRGDGDEAKAREHLRLSGYTEFGKPITLTMANGLDLAAGHTFSSKRIAEVVPGKVFALSGFEFTEYYFVVSDDGRELISIDAGTRPDSAKAAYEALRVHAPGLPALTTVLVTHAHWDHIGGHAYFRSLNPRMKIYARDNYHEELALMLGAPALLLEQFFGERFSIRDVESFKPDVTIDRDTELRIGGTRFEFIPVRGGETRDGLLIHLPDHQVMFAGDFIMPYLGAPFLQEGSLDGLLDTIDVVARKNPRHLLYGHEPLTRIFAEPAVLLTLKSHLAWLRGEVLAAFQRGMERTALQQANLIPPGLLSEDARAHVPYLVLRENVINRLYHQISGYWQPDLEGVDYVSRADRGSMLVDYLGVSEEQLAKAVERMVADGKHELAASALEWTRNQFPESERLKHVESLTYLKLMEKYQNFNPFKVIVYSRKSGMRIPQMGPKGAER